MDVEMKQTDMEADDDIDALNHLEARYYSEGYTSGFQHGKLHGLFEGRALGQEKSFELWEELGFMEGVAMFWKDVAKRQSGGLGKGKKVSARAANHIDTLLSLISAFPTYNPTPAPKPATNAISESSTSDSPDATPDEHDLAASLERIRARYRLLCSSLGIRPRLAAAPSGGDDAGDEDKGGVVMGIEGPMKGVDTKLLRF